jgi:hypothetical protein
MEDVFVVSQVSNRTDIKIMSSIEFRSIPINKRYFDYCQIKGDNHLEFGNEHGNYAGGTLFSKDFYPSAEPYTSRGYFKGSPLFSSYEDALKDHLLHVKENDTEFFNAIIEAAKANNVRIDLSME